MRVSTMHQWPLFPPHPLDAVALETATQIEAMRVSDPKTAAMMDDFACEHLREWVAKKTVRKLWKGALCG